MTMATPGWLPRDDDDDGDDGDACHVVLKSLPHDCLLLIATRLLDFSPRGVTSARSLAALSCTCTTLRCTSFVEVVAAAAKQRWQIMKGIESLEALAFLQSLQKLNIRVGFCKISTCQEHYFFRQQRATTPHPAEETVKIRLRREQHEQIKPLAMLLRQHPRAIACIDGYAGRPEECGTGNAALHRVSEERALAVAADFLARGVSRTQLQLRACGIGGAVSSGWRWMGNTTPRDSERARVHGYCDVFFRLGAELLPPASEDWGFHAVRATDTGRTPPPRAVEFDPQSILSRSFDDLP